MHEGIALSTLGVVFAVIAEFGPLLAAVAVCIDVARRSDSDFTGSIPGGRWTWIAPNLLFLLVVALGYLGLRATALSATVAVLYAIVLIVDFAYLLRVVFPSPARRTARELATTTIGRLPEE